MYSAGTTWPLLLVAMAHCSNPSIPTLSRCGVIPYSRPIGLVNISLPDWKYTFPPISFNSFLSPLGPGHDTALISLLHDDKECHGPVLKDFVEWCDESHLVVNTNQIKEMCIDFRNNTVQYLPLKSEVYIHLGDCAFKQLGNFQKMISWLYHSGRLATCTLNETGEI